MARGWRPCQDRFRAWSNTLGMPPISSKPSAETSRGCGPRSRRPRTAPLAWRPRTLETEIALTALLTRLPNLRLAIAEVDLTEPFPTLPRTAADRLGRLACDYERFVRRADREAWLRSPADHEHATAESGNAHAMAWRRQVRERHPAALVDAVFEHLRDRPTRLLAADGDDHTREGGCPRASPRIRHRGEPAPSSIPGPVALEVEEIRVQAGRPSADCVDGARERCDSEVLARRRSRDDRPTLRSQVSERVSGSRRPAPPPRRQSDGTTPAPAAARGNGIRGSDRRAPLEDGRGTKRSAVSRVAADDIEPPGVTHCGGVMDANRKIGKPPPRVSCRRVGIDTSRRAAVEREPTENHDLAPHGRSRDLRTRNGHRRAGFPLG
jgi:hypothetical protein